MEFIKYNANPKNKKTGDCMIRALSKALDKSWTECYTDLFNNTLKTCYSVSDKKNLKSYLKKLGYEMEKMPRKENNKRYTIEEFADNLAKKNETYIILIANHITVIKDKILYDTWNCKHKSVGNYWIIKNGNN